MKKFILINKIKIFCLIAMGLVGLPQQSEASCFSPDCKAFVGAGTCGGSSCLVAQAFTLASAAVTTVSVLGIVDAAGKEPSRPQDFKEANCPKKKDVCVQTGKALVCHKECVYDCDEGYVLCKDTCYSGGLSGGKDACTSYQSTQKGYSTQMTLSIIGAVFGSITGVLCYGVGGPFSLFFGKVAWDLLSPV